MLDRASALENIVFRSTAPEFEHQSQLFSRGGQNPLRGCVSDINGVAVRTWRPTVEGAPNAMSYLNRKGFFALNMQAAVGADFKAQSISVVAAGSCHDSTAFSACGLAQHLASEDSLPDGFWMSAGDAYIAGIRGVTP